MANTNIQYRLQKARIIKYLEKLNGKEIMVDKMSEELSINNQTIRQILNQIYKQGHIQVKGRQKYYQPPERKYEFVVDYNPSEDKNYLMVDILVKLNGKEKDRVKYKLSLVKIYNRDVKIYASLMIVKLINYIERNDLKKYINDKIEVFTMKPIIGFDDHFFKDINPFLLKKLNIKTY